MKRENCDTKQQKNDLISIVIPVYNVEEYLDRCIASVRGQIYDNLEIILVDDGSTDRSGIMCDEYARLDSRIKVIHKPNSGLSDARNEGLKHVTGTYIGFVDSDDWIEPQMYDMMYRGCIRENADIAICRYNTCCEGTPKQKGVDNISSDNISPDNITVLTRDELLDAYLEDREDIIIYNSVWSKLFKAELVRGFVFPMGQNSEDIMYTTKAFCNAKRAVYIDGFFYNYVIDRQGSIMNEKRIERMFRDELPFWREHISYISEHISEAMGNKAAYYYYRRLLFYFIDYRKSVQTKSEAKKIADEYRENKTYIKMLCTQDFASKKDAVRLRLICFSPELYYYTDVLYNKFIIPMKRKVRRYHAV